jgi:hypothetical protein
MVVGISPVPRGDCLVVGFCRRSRLFLGPRLSRLGLAGPRRSASGCSRAFLVLHSDLLLELVETVVKLLLFFLT